MVCTDEHVSLAKCALKRQRFLSTFTNFFIVFVKRVSKPSLVVF